MYGSEAAAPLDRSAAGAAPSEAARVPAADSWGTPLERVFALVSDLLVVTERDGTIVLVNPAWETSLGYGEAELIGRSVWEFVHPEDAASTRAVGWTPDGIVNYTNRYRHKDGSWRWLMWSGRRDGARWYGVAKDVTDKLMLERRALSDELTGLANRALLLDHLRGALARLGRSEDKLVAVLFVDLDGFKLINDSHGHQEGDRILTEVAQRLREVVRAGDVVSRFGGDEFVIVAESLTQRSEAALLGERVIEAVSRGLTIGGVPCSLSCSVGIALTRDASSDPDAMLREADTAMYRAKTRGAGKVELFDASVTPEVADRFQVAQDLRSALLADQLTVFYQPVITLADGALAGCEALVRWRHPDHGCLLPERFIEIAESSGLIVPLGQQVLEIACAQTRTWRATQPQMIVSVNVSRRQLVEPGFVDLVTNVLKEAGIPGEAICLEITETSTPIRDEVLDEVLHDVRALGVRIALDDFGSGYSTLANLRRLPIDLIKIDRIFTAGLAASAADRGIVRSVLSLARELNVTVVAEGVETPEQLSILRGLGCRFAQGYLFAAPAPPEVLLEGAALAAWRAACSRS